MGGGLRDFCEAAKTKKYNTSVNLFSFLNPLGPDCISKQKFIEYLYLNSCNRYTTKGAKGFDMSSFL